MAAATLGLCVLSASGAPYNASGPGEWISLGYPTRMYVGTEGDFYIIGSDMGTCAATRPTYIRASMNDPKFKEFYALLLYAAASQKVMECVVDSGCGADQVWTKYCAVSF